MNMYKIEEKGIVKYVNVEEVNPATLRDCINAGWGEDTLSIFTDDDGNMFDYESKARIKEEDRVLNYLCISYWDGNNWHYDIHEDCEIEYIENVSVIERNDRNPNPCYYFCYDLMFSNGSIIEVTQSNISGKISPYYTTEEE